MRIIDDLLDGAEQPEANECPYHAKSNLHWRLSVSFGILALYAGFAVLLGQTPIFAGYATKSEVEAQKTQIALIQQQQDDIQAQQIDADIVLTRDRQCKAIKTNNYDSQRFAIMRINEKMSQYWHLTRQAYRLPDCAELGG